MAAAASKAVAGSPASLVATGGLVALDPEQPAGPIRPVISWRHPAPTWAGLIEYSAAALSAMRPAAPAAKMFAPVVLNAAEPRITLPGPALPRELHSLAAAGLSTLLERPRRADRSARNLRMVLMTLAAAVVCCALLLYIVPTLLSIGKSAQLRAEATSPAADPVSPGAPSNSDPASYPLAKTVEVTGFRLVVDLNKQSEIHYLVVNHSPVQFGGVTVFVTLRSSDAKPGQPPVARFSFKAPDMEPYSSREMTSLIEKMSRQVSLPDWQDLRAEVEVAE